MDYYFIYGPSLKKVLQRYGELMGTMSLPPKWSFGCQQCHWSYYPESEVMELAQRLTRVGFSGVQRYSAVWTGDNVASWEHLKLSINMCLGLSMSGVSFCGTDIGGFIGTPTPELFTRWIQLGTFTPLFRTHTHNGSPDQEPWSFGEWHEEINKKFIQLRYRLLPYIYDAFHESSIRNTPIMRPMVYEYQDDPRTTYMDDQFIEVKSFNQLQQKEQGWCFDSDVNVLFLKYPDTGKRMKLEMIF